MKAMIAALLCLLGASSFSPLEAPSSAAPASALASVLQIPGSILAVPEPSTAWLFGLGFLALVVLRRTRMD